MSCIDLLLRYFSLQAILDAKKLGVENNVKIPGNELLLERSGNAPQLARLRRQFLTYSKMQQLEINQIGTLFVQYLNKSL